MRQCAFSLAIVVALAGSVAAAETSPSRAVVINEILYHAPDDLDLEYIEVHNPGDAAVDLAGWKFRGGIEYTFPPGARIEAGGYLVLARAEALLKELYGISPYGAFSGSLSNGGEKLKLANAGGEVIDSVSYGDRTPWPLSADGYSASLERICPAASGEAASNWLPSQLSDQSSSKAGGSPGARNDAFAPSLPPVVTSLTIGPTVCRPGVPIAVEAVVETAGAPLASVAVLYRVVEPGNAGEELSVPMERQGAGRFRATLPGAPGNRIVRIRVRATDASGAVRLEPPEQELRPARSVWVSEEIATGKIPVAYFFNVGDNEFKEAAAYLERQRQGRGRGGFPGFGPFNREGRGPDRRGGPGEREFRGREFREPGVQRQRPEERDDERRRPEGRRPEERRFEGRGFGGRGFGRFGERPTAPPRPQGRSALVYVDPASKETRLFDFVNITERKSGYKVRLHKDRPLNGMTTINVLYEPDERSILNEAMAYDLYRLAGNATPAAGYLRVLIDGQVAGHHLMFEQPNGAFFQRIDRAGGNLYKVIWQGSNRPSRYTPAEKIPARPDVVGRHEKKTNPHDGYEDLVQLVETLERTEDPARLWEIIQERFDVDQVINYFAVNTLLSHWDGFFNNYFLYHDLRGAEKWTMYPWDQDSTWGHRMSRDGEVFAGMPLTFGMEGDVPPGAEPDREGGSGRRRGGFGFGGFGRGAPWWRPGGEISRPLLANPHFRERFLARLKVLAETVYTEAVFGPRFEALREQLEEEVRLRARVSQRSEDDAVRSLDETLAFFREHLVRRRDYILANLDETTSPAQAPAPQRPERSN